MRCIQGGCWIVCENFEALRTRERAVETLFKGDLAAREDIRRFTRESSIRCRACVYLEVSRPQTQPLPNLMHRELLGECAHVVPHLVELRFVLMAT